LNIYQVKEQKLHCVHEKNRRLSMFKKSSKIASFVTI